MDAFRLFDVVDIQKRVVAYVVAVYVYKIASESLALVANMFLMVCN